MPSTYFDIKEVARLLGVDWQQVNKIAQRGDIPCQKVSGMFRFNQAKITDWLQSRVTTLSEKDLSDLDSGHSAQRKFRFGSIKKHKSKFLFKFIDLIAGCTF